MQKTYWTLFALGLLGIILSILIFILILVLTNKGVISKKYGAVATAALLFTSILSLYLIIPCIKDYSLVSNSEFLEEEAIAVEFTYINRDPDGTGETQYSKPKFYIISKDKYVVLNIANIEIGKTYRIRYYPNTKIGEVVY